MAVTRTTRQASSWRGEPTLLLRRISFQFDRHAREDQAIPLRGVRWQRETGGKSRTVIWRGVTSALTESVTRGGVS